MPIQDCLLKEQFLFSKLFYVFIKDSSGMSGHREAQLRLGRVCLRWLEGVGGGTHLDTRLGLITGRKDEYSRVLLKGASFCLEHYLRKWF